MGEGGGGSTTNPARSSYYIYVLHDLHRDIVVGLLSKLFELDIMFPTYYYYYYTQINTKKVGVEKGSFSWCGQSFQEIEAQSL